MELSPGDLVVCEFDFLSDKILPAPDIFIAKIVEMWKYEYEVGFEVQMNLDLWIDGGIDEDEFDLFRNLYELSVADLFSVMWKHWYFSTLDENNQIEY